MTGADRRPAKGPPWPWRLVVGAVVWFLRRLFGWRTYAVPPDQIPEPTRPLVVVFNHTSNIDAFLVVDVLWRRLRHWCQPLVKAELFDVAVLGPLARGAGAIPVTRTDDAAREQAYDAAVARLHAGGTIMIAPEGTVTHDGTLLPLRHGAARLALEAGVDVLVVTHFGAQRAFSPVARMPDRDVLVTMRMDLLQSWPDEDESTLTGRIAATMIDRSAELRAAYPQADETAHWWPPYSRPASPTATARENLERYRRSMAEAVANARERMARMSEEYEIEHWASQLRERMARFADDHEVEERVAELRERMTRFADEHDVEERVAALRERAATYVEEVAARSRARAEQLTEQARQQLDDLTATARERAASFRYGPVAAAAVTQVYGGPPERYAGYDAILADLADVEWDAAGRVARVRGEPFSFLDADGQVALRLPVREREVFLARHGTRFARRDGRVLDEYVVVSDELLARPAELRDWVTFSRDAAASHTPSGG